MNEITTTPKTKSSKVESVMAWPFYLESLDSVRTSSTDKSIIHAITRMDNSRVARIAAQIKDKIKNQVGIGIESVWLEDLGKQINVYVMTNDVRDSTLDPIFDARLALNSEYPHISFDFELNPIDLEQKQLDNLIQRVI
jgi:hypothetical protein